MIKSKWITLMLRKDGSHPPQITTTLVGRGESSLVGEAIKYFINTDYCCLFCAQFLHNSLSFRSPFTLLYLTTLVHTGGQVMPLCDRGRRGNSRRGGDDESS